MIFDTILDCFRIRVDLVPTEKEPHDNSVETRLEWSVEIKSEHAGIGVGGVAEIRNGTVLVHHNVGTHGEIRGINLRCRASERLTRDCVGTLESQELFHIAPDFQPIPPKLEPRNVPASREGIVVEESETERVRDVTERLKRH